MQTQFLFRRFLKWAGVPHGIRVVEIRQATSVLCSKDFLGRNRFGNRQHLSFGPSCIQDGGWDEFHGFDRRIDDCDPRSPFHDVQRERNRIFVAAGSLFFYLARFADRSVPASIQKNKIYERSDRCYPTFRLERLARSSLSGLESFLES